MLKIEAKAVRDWSGGLTVEFLTLKDKGKTEFLGREIGSINVVEKGDGDGVERGIRVSLGEAAKLDAARVRRAATAVSRWLAERGMKSAGIKMDSIDALKIEGARSALCEGLMLGDFRFDRYHTGSKKKSSAEIALLTEKTDDDLGRVIQEADALIDSVNLARAWAHEPPNVINPVTLAEWSQELASDSGLKCTILDEKALKKLKAGAILAVGGGSNTQPRMIILEWPGSPESADLAPVVIAGKAITFDTGGYTIKTRAGMVGMKFDKGGGVVVAGIMKAVAALKLKYPVVGIIAAAENAISTGAYRPNDIITTLSGKTVEIISTDAEGRLVLADALSYAQKTYKPKVLIDIATLTGGIVTALGKVRAGIMATDDALAEELLNAGERTFERLWRMPLDEEYFRLIKGHDSDIKNSAGLPFATPVVGGMFLKQFVEDDVPWAHLDIAGVNTIGTGLLTSPRRATGFGVRLLVDYLRHLES
jgi:leucyl aminopeptidase